MNRKATQQHQYTAPKQVNENKNKPVTPSTKQRPTKQNTSKHPE